MPSLLGQAIDAALKPPAISGSPDRIKAQAEHYQESWGEWWRAWNALHIVVGRDLPTAWRGAAAESATQAVDALVRESSTGAEAFAAGTKTLNAWAETLKYARDCDDQGRTQLKTAREQLSKAMLASATTSLSQTTMVPILEMASTGCHDRLVAAKNFAAGAAETASALRQWAERARARRVGAPGVSPLTKVVLAATAREILTPTALQRASQRLQSMSAADRSAFEKLLADSKSPLEAAFLWKTLASGYSSTEIQDFYDKIHPHGDDEKWLTDHLQPDIANRNAGTGEEGQHILRYLGEWSVPNADGNPEPVYGQDAGNCVAVSTVGARANSDPAFMLGLTTGQGPAAVGGAKAGDDSLDAFRKRLVESYHSTDATYSSTSQSDDDRTKLFDRMFSPSTGTGYEYQRLTDADSRTAALPRIEAAVESGKPVPVQVDDSTYGGETHEMMIIGAEDGKLEIYNPWGFTQWVTNDEFIDGRIGALTEAGLPNGGMPIPIDVQLPK
ncbi:hypothetical protein [Nocardia sp. NBC_01009]|uniref:hypothetical protein n=1 Tax=Nocardia sp. NBC_01009 TaxID=2975996 RepID=UPI00386F52FF|nr:hypothetical protein OHA42_38590 [Nocardia sp. NBC_01009]